MAATPLIRLMIPSARPFDSGLGIDLSVAVATVWIGAYLIAGFLYVRRDMRQCASNRPNYVYSVHGRWLVRLLWIPTTVMLFQGMIRHNSRRIWMKYVRTEAAPTYLTFLAIGLAGTWLLSN